MTAGVLAGLESLLYELLNSKRKFSRNIFFFTEIYVEDVSLSISCTFYNSTDLERLILQLEQQEKNIMLQVTLSNVNKGTFAWMF